jgi:hypothetical protein
VWVDQRYDIGEFRFDFEPEVQRSAQTDAAAEAVAQALTALNQTVRPYASSNGDGSYSVYYRAIESARVYPIES